jgi:hypothetical protein
VEASEDCGVRLTWENIRPYPNNKTLSKKSLKQKGQACGSNGRTPA